MKKHVLWHTTTEEININIKPHIMTNKILLIHEGKELGAVRCIINKKPSNYYGEVYFNEFSFMPDLENKNDNGLINKATVNVIPVHAKNEGDSHKKIDEITYSTYNVYPGKIYE